MTVFEDLGATRPDAFVPLEITRMPIFSKRIEPEYPVKAKRAWKGGTVVLEATIDVDGKAKDIVIKEDKVGIWVRQRPPLRP